MPVFEHDGLNFHYQEAGQGQAFVFQHGLGGDVNQPFGLFNPPDGFRLLALDCRAHGDTRPVGASQKIGITSFAEDLNAFLDHVDIHQAIVGGISMGAAVTLNYALRFPKRVLGLVQSRPAWLAEPNRKNAERYSFIARLIREHGSEGGKQRFLESDLYRQTRKESPDVANSFVGQFEHARAAETLVRLERVPNDTPCGSLDELQQIRVPTLVMANRQDPVHPFEFGRILAEKIPNAEFQELTAKSISPDRHAADVQRLLSDFLVRNFARTR